MEGENRDGEGGVGKGEEENETGEKRRKVGRPTKAVSWSRERTNSLPLIDLMKRGEKRKENEVGDEERDIFKKSSKVKRSPERREEGGLGELLKEMREGFRELKEELREMRESREKIREGMEEMRRSWERENEELRKRLDKLEKKMGEREKGGRGEERDMREGDKDKKEKIEQIEIRRGEMKELEERMKRLELEEERKKREERKRNIIIKGVKLREEGIVEIRKEIEEIVETTGARAKVEGVRRIGNKNMEGRGMVWVRFASVREKIEVMKGKAKLRDRSEWIVDDLTEKERRIDWWIKREAERNRREGRKVRVGYMKMWIDEKLWVWDEIKEELREWQGRESRREEKGMEGDKREKREKRVF